MIEITNLSKRYPDGTVALDKLNLKLNKRITTILGRNGAGKTTTIRIMSTQLLPTSGSVRIGELDVVKDVDMVRDIMSSIPQEIKPMGIANSYDHVAMYLSARGIPSKEIPSLVEKALRDLSLWDVRKKPAADLSGGMRRKKVCIFCADKFMPDYKNINLMRRFISDRGKILTMRTSGCCARHQRSIAQEIKKARQLGFIPYTVD